MTSIYWDRHFIPRVPLRSNYDMSREVMRLLLELNSYGGINQFFFAKTADVLAPHLSVVLISAASSIG